MNIRISHFHLYNILFNIIWIIRRLCLDLLYKRSLGLETTKILYEIHEIPLFQEVITESHGNHRLPRSNKKMRIRRFPFLIVKKEKVNNHETYNKPPIMIHFKGTKVSKVESS